jgi:hypothetical protein
LTVETLAGPYNRDSGETVRFDPCDSWRVPRWYLSIPHLLRWAVGGAIVLAGGGGVYGIVESVRDYPLSSWFGVTLYVAMLGAAAGFVLGLIAGAVSRRP